jgi:hemerythrin-like domain-containing protein
MNEKSPVEVLEEEHHFIQKVLGAMAVLVEALEAGEEVKIETLQEIVEFMRIFADKCHHGKEETHLFPALESKGVPTRGCPLGALISEHQKGRGLVADLAEATEAYTTGGRLAKESLLKSFHALMDLYPNHIWKEEYLAFPMADKILSSEEKRNLFEKFEMVENEIGLDVHERFEELAKKLEATASRPG